MATFMMFGKYSVEALKGIKPQRTQQVVDMIEKAGGKVEAMYATLGQNDLVFVIDFPGVSEAMTASVAIGKATGIGFTTAPAVSVAQFDKLTG